VTSIQHLIEPAAEAIGWKADAISPFCFGMQTTFRPVPLLFVRTATATSGSAHVLDVCLPLAAEPDDDAVHNMTAINGSGAQLVSASWFAEYEGADGQRHLGAFVRIPIAPTFLDSRPLSDLLTGALEHLWAASMMFGRFVEYCEDSARPLGCRPVNAEGIIPLRPADHP